MKFDSYQSSPPPKYIYTLILKTREYVNMPYFLSFLPERTPLYPLLAMYSVLFNCEFFNFYIMF